MFLAIDIGNSTIKFGLYHDDKLTEKISIPTKKNNSPDKLIFEWLNAFKNRAPKIDSILISSVVPEVNPAMAEACEKLFQITPQFIDSNTNFGLKSIYDPPDAAGRDRLVNIYAAVKKYGLPVIVCSFGTATTIDAVDALGTYRGGIIAPGMGTMADALHRKTSQLPLVEVKPAEKVIGNSTGSSILSGIYFGHAGMAEKMIERISAELAPLETALNAESSHPFTVATGGFAKMLAPEIKNIDKIDENLTLDGLYLLSKEIK